MSTSERTPLLNDNEITERVSSSNDADDDEEENNKSKRKRVLTSFALGGSVLVQSYLVVGVFPYAGFMAIHLVPNLNEENAGSYAGLIASAFMVGRTVSSFGWGRLSDKYGRVFVIKASLLLSAVFMILFGLAPTFRMALIWRCTLGLCNGYMGPVKTLITEYNRGHEDRETQMVALVFGMWGYGFLISPAIAGYLADPVKQYSNSRVVEIFEPILKAYPFVLPNIVGSLLCLIAYVLVLNFVQETLPSEKRQWFRWHTIVPNRCNINNNIITRTVSSWRLFQLDDDDEEEISEERVILLPPSKEEGERRGAKGGEDEDEEAKPATICSLWKHKPTRQHLLVYWIYSFLITSLDESFPLFCLSKTSGLAIHEKTIGNILSGTGFVFVAVQYFLVTGLVRRFGFYTTLSIGAFFSVPFSCLIPLSLITNKDTPEGAVAWPTLLLLCMLYGAIRICSSLVISTITMTSNRTVSLQYRGTMQGLSQLGGSVAKSFGPAFAGILFSWCVGHLVAPIGSVVVFIIISILGLCLAVQTLMLQDPGDVIENSNNYHEEKDRSPTF